MKSLAEENGTLTMVNNGTGPCVVYLLNPFKEQKGYLDDFWTDSATNPIELHDQNGVVLKFTKFDNIGQFYLQDNFYKIVVPPNSSFTVVGHDNIPNK